MAKNYDSVDLLWTSSTGDIALDPTGDIADTSADALRAVSQDLYTRVKSDIGDWDSARRIGATLSDFAGEPNNLENGMSMQDRIYNSLQTYGVFSLADLTVRVYPTGPTSVDAEVRLRVQPTPWNKNSNVIDQVITYSFSDNHSTSKA